MLVLSAAVWMSRRADAFRRRAEHHRDEADYCFREENFLGSIRVRRGGKGDLGGGRSPETIPDAESIREAEHYDRLMYYHLSLMRKYLQAASYPWLPVAPDLPPP